jgi:hypothetical protein
MKFFPTVRIMEATPQLIDVEVDATISKLCIYVYPKTTIVTGRL